MPHPLKHRSPLGAAFKEAEEHLEGAIRARFGIRADVPEIKRADRALLATERRAFSAESWHWPELDGVEPLDLELEAWAPDRRRRVRRALRGAGRQALGDLQRSSYRPEHRSIASRARMSRFAHVNLLDVDDSISGRVEGLEGRFARKHLESRDLGVSHFRYAPGFRSPAGHRHREQEEAYVVVGGSGQMLIDDELLDLRPWDVVRVAPGVILLSRRDRTGSR